jgi:hypothetical protein
MTRLLRRLLIIAGSPPFATIYQLGFFFQAGSTTCAMKTGSANHTCAWYVKSALRSRQIGGRSETNRKNNVTDP